MPASGRARPVSMLMVVVLPRRWVPESQKVRPDVPQSSHPQQLGPHRIAWPIPARRSRSWCHPHCQPPAGHSVFRFATCIPKSRAPALALMDSVAGSLTRHCPWIEQTDSYRCPPPPHLQCDKDDMGSHITFGHALPGPRDINLILNSGLHRRRSFPLVVFVSLHADNVEMLRGNHLPSRRKPLC